MAPVFVFADFIRKALQAGQKEIEIPEGARISAAAYDIIREHKLRVIPVKSAADSDDPKGPEGDEGAEGQEGAEEAQESRSAEEQPPSAGIGSAPLENGEDISDDVVEAIVDRVIARFREIKGLKPDAPAAPEEAGSEADAGQAQDDDLVICRCEEITKGEIRNAIRNGMQTLNGIKRITRAGMGLCQGQTCQRLVAQILSEELGFSAAEIDPTTARGPVRPVQLEVFANS